MAEHDVQPGVDAFEQMVALLDYPTFVVTTRAGDELSPEALRPRRPRRASDRTGGWKRAGTLRRPGDVR